VREALQRHAGGLLCLDAGRPVAVRVERLLQCGRRGRDDEAENRYDDEQLGE